MTLGGSSCHLLVTPVDTVRYLLVTTVIRVGGLNIVAETAAKGLGATFLNLHLSMDQEQLLTHIKLIFIIVNVSRFPKTPLHLEE